MKITEKYSLNICWSEEDQSYVCTSSLLPGLMAFGNTKEEALAEGEIALEGMLQSLKDEGSEVPQPDILEIYSGHFTLRLPRSFHRRLTEEAHKEGVSLNQLILFRLSESQGKQEIINTVVEKYEHHTTYNVYKSENNTDFTVSSRVNLMRKE